MTSIAKEDIQLLVLSGCIGSADFWMSSVGAEESRPAERRASNKSFLPPKSERYLEWLD